MGDESPHSKVICMPLSSDLCLQREVYPAALRALAQEEAS
jgi:hypothetical protein